MNKESKVRRYMQNMREAALKANLLNKKQALKSEKFEEINQDMV